MIKTYRITEMLYDHCQKVVVKNNSWLCRCPLCGDSTTKSHVRRFHIDFYSKYNTYMYKCYRCGRSNNVYMLCSKLYDISYKEAKKFLNDTKYNSESVKKSIKGIHIQEHEHIQSELDLNIQNECYNVSSTPNDRNGKNFVKKLKYFIKQRKASEPCFIAHSGRYKSRIIIPVINNNKLEYFQGRSIYKDIEPKYLNPVVDKTPIIYHKDKIKSSRDIIITEGLLDAMAVGKQCTSTLGADISDKKISILLGMTEKTVIICLDNDDAGMNALKRFINKSKYKKVVKYFLMPKKFSHIKDMNKLLTTLETDNTNLENFVLQNIYSYFYVKTLLKF